MHMLSTIRSSNSMSGNSWATFARAVARNRPSVCFMMLALWTAVTFLRPLCAGVLEGVADDPLAAGDADRLDRDAGLVAAGADLPLRRNLVEIVDQLAGRGLARLELDAGVKVLGVLADDHQVDRHVLEEGPHAGVILARPDAGVQAQLLPQVDVDAAEAGAHGRGDGGLQGAAGAADALHRGLRQRRAQSGHHVHARLLHVPVDLHAGRVDAAPRGRGQFRARRRRR